MKIAFWSEQQGAGTTFNLAVTACAAVLLHPITVAVVPGGYHDEILESRFFQTADSTLFSKKPDRDYGQQAVFVAESEEYFLSNGLEYLLRQKNPEALTERLIKANMRQVVTDRMYCLSASPKPEREWWYRDSLFARMAQVMGAVESCFDIVFIDCGNRQDDYAKKVLQEADICVLNMIQGEEIIGEFYRNPPRVRGKIFFLLGKYFESALYNRKNLQRLYRVEEDRLGAMPYNPQLQAASQRGRIIDGVKCYIGSELKGKNVEFEKELIRTTNLILKLAGVIA
ncbi:hypothetical protein AALA36_02945 [Lachnospiraceae bacterium 66-29]